MMAQILSRILSYMGFFTQIDKQEIEKNFDELSKMLLSLKEDMSNTNQRIDSKQIESMQTFSDMEKDVFFKFAEYEKMNKEMMSNTQMWGENITSLMKECLNQQYEVMQTVQKLCQDILENSNVIKEILNNIDKIKLIQLNQTITDNHAVLSEYITKNQTAYLKEIKAYAAQGIDTMELQKKREEELLAFLRESFSQQSIKMETVNSTCENIFQNNSQIKDTLIELNKDKMTKDDLDVVSSFLRLLAANQLMHSASEVIEK